MRILLRTIFVRSREFISLLLVLSLILPILPPAAQAQTAVTLTPATAPASGQPGVHTMNVTGSGFPTGTISPGAVTIKFEPTAPGAGPTATTQATAVTTIVGSTRRVTFTIPSSLVFTTATAYLVSLSGSTTGSVSFASGNKSALTINPLPKILSLNPSKVKPGETVHVTITTEYTNFVQGSTVANFGPSVSVGGASEGAFGSVTVLSPTTATATLSVNSAAEKGFRSVVVKTGVQQASLVNTFTVGEQERPPEFSLLGAQSGAEGKTLSFQVNATDPNQDPLTYAAMGLPVGASFDPPTRTFSWTPSFDQAGTYHVVFSVSDGKATTEMDVAITIANTNRLPVFTTDGIPAAAPAGQAYQATVAARDDDGDVTTFSLLQAPPGMTIDPTTGQIAWVPLASQTGTHTVTVQVDDGAGGRATKQYTITVPEAAAGISFVLGRVYDDTVGLPLEGADVRVGSINSSPLSPLPTVLTDAMGRYSFSFQNVTGDAVIEAGKKGFTRALRHASLAPNRSTQVFDMRLTPRNAQMVSASMGGNLTSGDANLTIPPL